MKQAGRRSFRHGERALTTPWTVDTRWERTKLAYDALVYGDGLYAASAADAVAAAYERARRTSSCRPRWSSVPVVAGVPTTAAVDPAQSIRDGDVCLLLTSPRPRPPATRAFREEFDLFDRGPHPPVVDVVTMI